MAYRFHLLNLVFYYTKMKLKSPIFIPLIKNLNRLFFSLPIAYCLIACSSHNHSDKKIFRYNESNGIASLDPAFAKSQSVMWAVHQLYNTLIEVDDNMKLSPSL